MKLAGFLLVAVSIAAPAAFAQRGRGGAGRAGWSGGGRVGRPSHGRTVIVPYPTFYSPSYYGSGYYDPGYYGNGYDSSVPAQPPLSYDSDAANYASGYQSPTVIINQNFRPDTANPVVRTYDATTTPAQEPQPTIYLIALKDHSIVAAIGYWVDSDTLNYLTVEGNQNRVSVALVDRDFSKKLNDDRHVDFHLPPAK